MWADTRAIWQRAVRWAGIGAVLLLIGAAPAPAAPPDCTSLRTSNGPPLRLTPASIAFTVRYDRAPTLAAAPSASRDRWIAMDKAKHVGGSLLWTLSAQYVLVTKAGLSERGALPWSVASGAAVGMAKELYDRRYGPTRHFSRKDLVADGVGLALAVGVILL